MSGREGPVGQGARALVWACAVVALGLVAVGALVNAHQAALSVPDWPLSYGRLLLTEWPGNVRYEQLHRLLAAGALLLVAGTLLLARAGLPADGRRRLRSLAVGLGLQVLLGGAVVLALAPAWLSGLHLVVALLLAAGFLELAIDLSASGAPADGAPMPARLARRTAIVLVLLTLQVVLGALARHPPAGQTAFIVTTLVHVANGLVAVGFAVALGIALMRTKPSPALARAGAAVLLAAVLQLAVGVFVFFIAPEPLAAESHVPPEGFPLGHLLHLLLAAVLLGTTAWIRSTSRP